MPAVVETPFHRISYTEAIEQLQAVVASGHKFEVNTIEWGMDLGSEHERYLCEVPMNLPPPPRLPVPFVGLSLC